ncbi:U3 small nucleolar RNA-associated protein 6-domain-containing protein [Halteromyces radiatus]|uniref:U3 small nucleolar RNA-associated protein 6-domain-containing protein n=1 Tax=Halteromyces radiatus TaxID=101107 RepID=UPI0022208EA7|nr:U3 small nucleolar RNA-associated protein 6-domain-containing protein [Halteromyces radiatus]KAI8082717.1 U3 small nucleolar RNA-associated protein 6-domain-containing protein [Halteromyces radiatus]
MADTVQYYMERMVPELEELEKKGYFSDVEIKSIVKKRTNFEYAMNRRIAKKIDFLRSIEYEINLEALRKKRKKRITVIDGKVGTSEYSINRRIFHLFKRATNKFKGDLSLWIQYIEFAKKNDAQNILSGIFAQAIQFHPNKPSLWILASSWEFEDNANMGAARLLLQRGLRLNPDQTSLWHEYFRLELLYVEKIKARRRILGIDEKSEEQQKGDMEIDDEEEQKDDNMIQLPKITGEDLNNDSDAVNQLKEKTADALKEGMNPILQGLLATIVYKNAIAAHPDNLDFRTAFIDIYRTFTDTEKGCDLVYDSIRQDMNDNPHARTYLATRHLFTKPNDANNESKYISITNPSFVVALKASVDEFNLSVKELCVPLMWQLYLEFLIQWRKLISEENLKLYLTKLLQRTFTSCQKKDCLSEEIYKLWIDLLVDQDEITQAQSKAKEATKKYPHCPALWLARISLAQKEDGNDQPQMILFKQALENLPSSYDLWASYDDFLQRLSEENTLTSEEVNDLYLDACQRVTYLLPSVMTATEERNHIKDLILSNYIKWSADVCGIEAARMAYKKVIQSMYPTIQFYKTCLEVENTYGQGGQDGQNKVEYLFEMAVRMENSKEDTYLSYLSYLYSQKKFQKANTIYWKASKEVLDKATFDLRFQDIKNGTVFNVFAL